MRRGVVTLVIVILVSVIGLFVLVGWQARLLLAIQRSSSLSDLVAAAYVAESEAYDWVARFRGGYPQMFVPPLGNVLRMIKDEVLVDGTKMRVEAISENNEETLYITSQRQFSTTLMELSRLRTGANEALYDQVEMVMSVDCTGSMNSKSDASCNGTSCVKRIQSAKEAMLAFADSVANYNSSGLSPRLALGLSVFGVDAAWVRDTSGVNLRPTEDINEVISTINMRFGDTWDTSSACQSPLDSGGTNIGAGFDFMNRYIGGLTPDPRVKRIEILVTDGEPNSTPPSPTLATSYCLINRLNCRYTQVPNQACIGESKKFAACTLGDDATYVSEINKNGMRDDKVDAYAVTISVDIPEDVKVMLQRYATAHYDAVNASNLDDILVDLFNTIIEETTSITIRRVVPTPIR